MEVQSYKAENESLMRERIHINEMMILGAKFFSWANFPWFFQKQDSLVKT